MCEAEELYKKANSFMYAHEGKCDYKKAVELYSQAAEKDHLKSLQNLARIYKDGQIVVKDMDLSIKYYI
jgi:TPR repeat protein